MSAPADSVATTTLRGLLAEFPPPLSDEARVLLRRRLADLDLVRESFPEDAVFQDLCRAALALAGGRVEACTAAATARRERRDADTLRRLRWALVALVEAGRSPPPDAVPAEDDLAAWVAGARVFGDHDRLEEAAAWLGRALVVAPEDLEARALHAWTRWLLEIEPKWQDELRALAAAHPEDVLVAGLLAASLGD